MILKLSDVKVGQPKKLTEWNNKLQKSVEIDYKKYFISKIKSSNHKCNERNWEKHEAELELIKFSDDTLLQNAQHYHNNYLDYLEKCWADHLGIVITPDIIWYTILCEFASLVKDESETYRSLFTDSPEKKDITVSSGSLTIMPLDTLTEALRDNVPTDSNTFFPKFHTYTDNSKHAFLAAFCDICSPYYNYMMLLCGFPYIDIKGSIDDWKVLNEQWNELKKLIQQNEQWIRLVDATLNSIVSSFNDIEFWKNIFKIDHCGSGHQTLVTGWFTNLFRIQPRVRYAENFSSHVSNIKYKQLDTNKHYEMSVGLFNSILKDEFMEPSFSFIVYDTTAIQNNIKEGVESGRAS